MSTRDLETGLNAFAAPGAAYRVLPLVLWAMLTGAGASAEVRPAAPFTDNLVLQRARPVPIWGTAEPGETVTVAFAGATVSAKADARGTWKAQLPAFKESAEGRELTVAGKNTVTLKNVVVGDVWLCSGQSNMAMGLGGCLGAADDIAAADLPLIRQLAVATRSLPAPAPAAEVSLAAPWTPANPKTAAGFTAVGFYFARKVHEETGVPIGLINASWSSSPIETWLAPEGVAAVNELAAAERIARERLGAAEKPGADGAGDLRALRLRLFRELYVGYGSDQGPGGMFALHAAYEGMIRPLIPFAIKGVLWYQGEGNGGDGEPSIWAQRRAAREAHGVTTTFAEQDLYFHKMRALIGGWRRVWDQPEMPFYFVQLAGFQAPNAAPAGDPCWTHVRAAQTRALSIPRTGMAVTIDIGEENNIHPVNKYDVGLRLALWALARDYGQKGVVCSGPLFQKMEVVDGKARLAFDHVGGGLMAGRKAGRAPAGPDRDGKLARFAMAGADKVWHWAEARIEGEAVVVWSDKVLAPVAVRYAWSMNPAGANLYNAEGLPASPFRTDEW